MMRLFIASAISLITMQQAPAVELASLIKMFMLPASAGYNVLPWQTGSQIKAVNWEHDGIRDCPTYLAKTHSFCRTASSIVHINGKATPMVLKRRMEPAPWRIVLMGARAGVMAISLDSGIIGHELGEGLLKNATQKERTLKISQMNRCGGLGFGSTLYRISTSGRADAFVKETWSCGAANCSADLTIFLLREDAHLKSGGDC